MFNVQNVQYPVRNDFYRVKIDFLHIRSLWNKLLSNENSVWFHIQDSLDDETFHNLL